MSHIESTLQQSDEYVAQRAQMLADRGFLPAIESESSPTISQMRETMRSQESFTEQYGDAGIVMVPDGWLDVKKSMAANFRRGKVNNGIVTEVILEPRYKTGWALATLASQHAREEKINRGMIK